MTPITVVMPVRGRPDLTDRTLELLADEDVDRVLVFDNDEDGSAAGFAGYGVDVIPAVGLNIHEMWNRGWDRAGAGPVWFVNNDIDFCAGTAWRLRDSLDTGAAAVYPDYDRRVAQGIGKTKVKRTTGTYRVGGLCGWCFMVRRDLDCRFDETFGWWYGDDDFVRQIEAAGEWTGRVIGLPVDHLQEATAQEYPHLHEQKQRDAERYSEKWAA